MSDSSSQIKSSIECLTNRIDNMGNGDSELGHKAEDVDNSIKASWKFQIHEQTMGKAWYTRKKTIF